jgi:hypothetical protein
MRSKRGERQERIIFRASYRGKEVALGRERLQRGILYAAFFRTRRDSLAL